MNVHDNRPGMNVGSESTVPVSGSPKDSSEVQDAIIHGVDANALTRPNDFLVRDMPPLPEEPFGGVSSIEYKSALQPGSDMDLTALDEYDTLNVDIRTLSGALSDDSKLWAIVGEMQNEQKLVEKEADFLKKQGLVVKDGKLVENPALQKHRDQIVANPGKVLVIDPKDNLSDKRIQELRQLEQSMLDSQSTQGAQKPEPQYSKIQSFFRGICSALAALGNKIKNAILGNSNSKRFFAEATGRAIAHPLSVVAQKKPTKQANLNAPAKQKKPPTISTDTPKVQAQGGVSQTAPTSTSKSKEMSPQARAIDATFRKLAEAGEVTLPEDLDTIEPGQLAGKFSEWFSANKDVFSNIQSLQFESINLDYLPSELNQLTNLTDLRFYNCSGTAVPSALYDLKNLRNLCIYERDGKELSFDPDKLTQLPLKRLILPSKRMYDALPDVFREEKGPLAQWAPMTSSESKERQQLWTAKGRWGGLKGG